MSDRYETMAIDPDEGFANRLRVQLDERLNTPMTEAVKSTIEIEVVPVEAHARPARRRDWRRTRIVVAIAASVAVLVAIGVTVGVNDDRDASSELRDVDTREALPLAHDAFITADALGSRWRSLEMFTEAMYTEQTAATIAARPECSELTSMGLFTPTTKAAVARQSFSPGRNWVGHTVFVFASEADASRAMDAIAGDVYPTCWFDLFDRLVPLGPSLGTDASTSREWDPPAIATHGDRQIVIGQHATLVAPDATVEAYFVNAYIQVGRAISWINPMSGATPDAVGPAADRAISATAVALEGVFGP